MCLVDLGGTIVCFDTGLTPLAATAIQQLAAEAFGAGPALVVNSHYHNDHTWGNQVFAGQACIIGSEATRCLAETTGVQEYAWAQENACHRLAAARAAVAAADDERRLAAEKRRVSY